MKKSATLLVQALLLGLMLSAGATWAKDWPEWRGPKRDALCQETGLLKSWPAGGPKALWQAPMGKGYATLAVADGRVFTQYGNNEGQWLVALDEKTGKELWKVKTGEKFPGGGFEGPRSTPTVDGPRVYVFSGEGNLLCAEAASGKVLWQKDMMKEFSAKNLNWGVAMSPLVRGKAIYVNVGESQGASIVALDKLTGGLLWKNLNDMAGYASPVFATISGQPQLVFFEALCVVGVAPDSGKELWRYPWKSGPNVAAMTPLVSGDKVFISSGYGVGGALLQIDLKAKPPVKEVWKNKTMRCKFSNPILLDGYIYGFDENILRCVDFKTGESKWEQKGFDLGSILYADGLFYVLGEKGNLALAKLTPEKFEQISELTGKFGPRCWSMPVIANGKLFVRDEAKLICFDIKGK